MVDRVFVIGNGESRKDFDLHSLKSKGKIYGCNALYRDFAPDVLIAVDPGIIHEIYHNGYAYDNECWFRNWVKKLENKYKDCFYGIGCDFDNSRFNTIRKHFLKMTENEKGNSTEFVCHGIPIKPVLRLLNKTNNDEFLRVAKKHNINVSWIKKDKANNLNKIMPNNRDIGWSSGATAGYVAIQQHNPKEIYLIGHDFVSLSKKTNNLYKDTTNYAKSTHTATPGLSWKNQWKSLFKMYPKTKFFKVNSSAEHNNINVKINEWRGVKNITYITYEDLICNW